MTEIKEQKKEVFQQGKGVYRCSICNRKTRGSGEAFKFGLCRWCYEENVQENAHSDHLITENVYQEQLNKIEENRSHKQKGGRF